MPKTDAAFIMEAPSKKAKKIRGLSMETRSRVYLHQGDSVRVSAAGQSEEWVLGEYLTP